MNQTSVESVLPLVFAPDWVEQKRRRFERLPIYSRPRFYGLWTRPDLQPQRDRIERLFANLVPEQKRQNVASKLRDPDQYEHVRNELVVGESLRQLGHDAVYEPEICGLTPDWRVRVSDDDQEFVLEVLSSNPPEWRDQCNEAWQRFHLRLEGIPLGAALYVQPPFNDDRFSYLEPPSESRQKQIAHRVRRWLESRPKLSEFIYLDGITITMLAWTDTDSVCCGGGMVPFVVQAEPLRIAIRDKVRRYREMSASTKLPFVVCVIPDFESGRGMDDLYDAAFGMLQCRFRVTPDGRIHSQESYRNDDGLFSSYRSLSGLTVGRQVEMDLSHQFIPNPHADFPLSAKAFMSESARDYALSGNSVS
jgi:hypothetical protein